MSAVAIPLHAFQSAAQRIALAWCATIAPPRAQRTPLDVAHQVVLPDGPNAGDRFRPHPAQAAVLRAVGADRHQCMIILGPVQDGKTLVVIVVVLMWELFERHNHTVLCLPDLRLLGTLWRGKFMPIVENCEYDKFSPDEGPGSSTGVPSDVEFRGGSRCYLMGAGGRNEAGQASVTAKRVVYDEYDKIRARQAAAARKRNESFQDERREIRTSTISDDHNSPTWKDYQRSSQGRMVVRFPCCNLYHHLEWDAVEYDNTSAATARKTATIACIHCGTKHNDDVRRAAITETSKELHACQTIDDHGTVHGALDYSIDYGMRWSALDSPLRNLGELCAQHYEAIQKRDLNANHEDLRQFFRDQIVMPYEAGIALGNTNREAIARRSASSTYQRGTVPDGVQRIVVTIDVQRDRCYWIAHGSLQARRALIDWGEEYWTRKDQEPTDAHRHGVFDRIMAQARDGWPREDGTMLAARLIGVDIGYSSESVGRWVARHAGVLAIRGDDAQRTGTSLQRQFAGGMVEQRETAKPAADQPQYWWFIKTTQARELVRASLQIPTDQPGSMLLPQGIAADSYIARHLCSWQLEPDEHGTPIWVQHGRRDDYLDDCCYAEALHRLLDDQAAASKGQKRGRVGTYGARNNSSPHRHQHHHQQRR